VQPPAQKNPQRWRELFDSAAGGGLLLVVLVWVAYVWERKTGLVFITEHAEIGRSSTPEHLLRTLHQATGYTILCIPLALVWFGALRRKN
jgi:hypothetical protein